MLVHLFFWHTVSERYISKSKLIFFSPFSYTQIHIFDWTAPKTYQQIKKGLTSWVNYRTTRRSKFYRIIRNSSSCGILSSVCSQLIGTSSRGTLRVPDIFRYYLSCIISFRFCRLFSWTSLIECLFVHNICVVGVVCEFPSRERVFASLPVQIIYYPFFHKTAQDIPAPSIRISFILTQSGILASFFLCWFVSIPVHSKVILRSLIYCLFNGCTERDAMEEFSSFFFLSSASLLCGGVHGKWKYDDEGDSSNAEALYS